MRAGRFGPYVKWGKVNATIPKSNPPETIALDEALELIADREGKPVAEPRGRAKTSAGAKAAPGKGAGQAGGRQERPSQGEARRAEKAGSQDRRSGKAKIRDIEQAQITGGPLHHAIARRQTGSLWTPYGVVPLPHCARLHGGGRAPRPPTRVLATTAQCDRNTRREAQF